MVRVMTSIRRWGRERKVKDKATFHKSASDRLTSRKRQLSRQFSTGPVLERSRQSSIRSSLHGDIDCECWHEGLLISYDHGYLEAESISTTSNEFPGNLGVQGVLITCHSKCYDFSPMAFIVQELDSVIVEWYPGLMDLDSHGDDLVHRLVPCTICLTKYYMDEGDVNIHMFSLDECAVGALIKNVLDCPVHNGMVSLQTLVPDLLLTDLPDYLRLDAKRLEVTRDDKSYLGSGAMGVVYKGQYCGRLVAVKEYHPLCHYQNAVFDNNSKHAETELFCTNRSDSNPAIDNNWGSFREMSTLKALDVFSELRSELDILRAISHPCICKLVGVSMQPLCLALEFASLGSLFSVIEGEMQQGQRMKWLLGDKSQNYGPPLSRSGKRSEMDGKILTYKIALEIASALSYLHSQHIIYRDLKPENVLIYNLDVGCSSECLVSAKLSDYGISCFITPQGAFGNKGTAGYQAPEVIDKYNTSVYDAKIDIYSYGMVLYFLLSGHLPFHQLSHSAAINRAVLNKERPKFQGEGSDCRLAELVNVMTKCWSHSANDRPSATNIYDVLRKNGVQMIIHSDVLPTALPLVAGIPHQTEHYMPDGEIDTVEQMWYQMLAMCVDTQGSAWMIICRRSYAISSYYGEKFECWQLDLNTNRYQIIPMVKQDKSSFVYDGVINFVGNNISRVNNQLWIATLFSDIDVFTLLGSEQTSQLEFQTTFATKDKASVVEMKPCNNYQTGMCYMYVTLSTGYVVIFQSSIDAHHTAWAKLKSLCLTQNESAPVRSMVLVHHDSAGYSFWVACGADIINVNCKEHLKENTIQVYETRSPSPMYSRDSFGSAMVTGSRATCVRLLAVSDRHLFCNDRRKSLIHVYNRDTCEKMGVMDCSPRKCSSAQCDTLKCNEEKNGDKNRDDDITKLSKTSLGDVDKNVATSKSNCLQSKVASSNTERFNGNMEVTYESHATLDITEGVVKEYTVKVYTDVNEKDDVFETNPPVFISAVTRRDKVLDKIPANTNHETGECRILNFAVVEHTLWVVRSVGDILVLSLLPRDTAESRLAFGKVIAIIKLPQVHNYEMNDVKVMFTAGNHVLTVLSYARKGVTDSRSISSNCGPIKRFSQLHVWDKLTGRDIIQIQGVMETLRAAIYNAELSKMT